MGPSESAKLFANGPPGPSCRAYEERLSDATSTGTKTLVSFVRAISRGRFLVSRKSSRRKNFKKRST
jgi:hypothetical protein